MKDYSTYSFWLETAGDDLTPRPPLPGSIDVDVAVLGAGYTGLWTAYYLLKRDPSLRVALIEAEIAGFGASGRNGGWCTSGFSVSAVMLEKRFGREKAITLERAMADTVDEVGRVCEAEGIDAHFRKGGELRLARGAHQIPANQEALATYQRLGLADGLRLLDAREAAERIRVTNTCGALFIPGCAAIHPGRLVRGLARAVERCGATIYEGTRATDFLPGPSPRLRTDPGEVKADVVVLAGEAYLTRLPPLHRQLAPIYSLIVLTEPLSEALWQEIGWERQECVSSNRFVVDYLQRTVDGRILFGSRGEPYHWGSRIEDAYDRHEPTHRMIQGLVREWFPMLQGVRFTNTWGGPVGMPRDWMPAVTFDRQTGIASARGYTGQGVATSNLSGRLLADLITETDSPLLALPVVGHRSPNWEPEPLRWMAIRLMQRGYARVDRKAERSGKAPSGRSLIERLGRH